MFVCKSVQMMFMSFYVTYVLTQLLCVTITAYYSFCVCQTIQFERLWVFLCILQLDFFYNFLIKAIFLCEICRIDCFSYRFKVGEFLHLTFFYYVILDLLRFSKGNYFCGTLYIARQRESSVNKFRFPLSAHFFKTLCHELSEKKYFFLVRIEPTPAAFSVRRYATPACRQHFKYKLKNNQRPIFIHSFYFYIYSFHVEKHNFNIFRYY